MRMVSSATNILLCFICCFSRSVINSFCPVSSCKQLNFYPRMHHLQGISAYRDRNRKFKDKNAKALLKIHKKNIYECESSTSMKGHLVTHESRHFYFRINFHHFCLTDHLHVLQSKRHAFKRTAN